MRAMSPVTQTTRPNSRGRLEATALRISTGHVVAINYELTRSDGTFVEAFVGEPAFLYLHGAGNIVPGLERELVGRTVGDRLHVTVPPELAYGPLRPEFVQRVSRSHFPAGVQVYPGMRFGSRVDGRVLPAWVTEVGQHDATVSFNHPLAGETLHFTVEVLDVRPARLGERAHGHPHGPGGVEH